MTDEQRSDRLERISKLMSKAGLRARRQSREQDVKINILIDSQIKNEKRSAALAPAQAALATNQAGLAQGHAETGDHLNALIGTVERYITGRDGGA